MVLEFGLKGEGLVMEKIHFYHTNDVHSHFENWPQISRFLRDQKEKHQRLGEAVYITDIGDFVDRSHPFTEGTNGKGNIQLLNQAGYDVVTIGNNEGITMSKEDLSSLYDEAEFDVIVGNLADQNGEYPPWLVPSIVYKTDRGTRIGVIGATASYPQFYSLLGWRIFPPREQLRATAEHLSKETDIIVCLSHMGQTEDERLAMECPSIDVIFGAHTHHLFREGKVVGKSLLAATGKFGDYVGEVTVNFDTELKKVVHKSATVYPAHSLPVSNKDIEKVNDLIAIGKKKMDEPVFYNPRRLKQNLFSRSPLSNFFGRALISHTDADCAIFNAGIFLGNLEKGWVTKRHLHSLLPHPINICVIELDGHQLLEIYELSNTTDWPRIEIKGLGFRGVLMGAMIHERLFKNRHGTLFAGNREVVPGAIYKLATLDMFTFGFFFPQLKEMEKEYYMPELIRDVLGEYGKYSFQNE